jgi:hypothetical protein
MKSFIEFGKEMFMVAMAEQLSGIGKDWQTRSGACHPT